jgi:hypothetical protein
MTIPINDKSNKIPYPITIVLSPLFAEREYERINKPRMQRNIISLAIKVLCLIIYFLFVF